MHRDGPERIGRFIKKSNKRLLKCVALNKFSFEEICGFSLLYHDNVGNSIIYTKMHEDAELDSCLSTSEELNREFRREDQRRPILRPLDFTADWRRQKARSLRRASKMDEEDEFELELEFHKKLEESERKRKKKYAPGESNYSAEAAGEQVEESAKGEATATDLGKEPSTEEVRPDEPMTPFQLQKKSIDEVGKAIKQLDSTETKPSVVESTEESAKTTATAGFIPTKIEERSNFNEQELKAASVGREQQQAVSPPTSQQEVSKAVDEAKALGFQQGFQLGEEKATFQIKQTGAELLRSVATLFDELKNLKKQVLNSVQENFYDLSQAITESLIRRELKVNPEVFGAIIKKAIAASVADDHFKIAVHPEYFEQLRKLGMSELSESLVADEKVKPGDFRIDSNLSSVDGNLTQVISDLLKQSEATLFDLPEEKAS